MEENQEKLQNEVINNSDKPLETKPLEEKPLEEKPLEEKPLKKKVDNLENWL